jgi:hypothetical protein
MQEHLQHQHPLLLLLSSCSPVSHASQLEQHPRQPHASLFGT